MAEGLPAKYDLSLGRQARDLVGTRQTTGYYLRQGGSVACLTQPADAVQGGRLTSMRWWFLKVSPQWDISKEFLAGNNNYADGLAKEGVVSPRSWRYRWL